MSINERMSDALSMMDALKQNGMDNLPAYTDLKNNLLEDATVLAKRLAKDRRAELLNQRKTRAETRALGPQNG
jgi:hypothetical protein